ncbi:bifunctional RNase H/acid phosphatase [uncultured Williamsia sp.]|uniref:bifunctional RNase H/acid phosphatase n=1 Tax=uncultured Williamsia sp. TaxID=259311 RepID=UPI00261BC6B8|nr:bifunctional RNase H/acid phosphatase [uncultured Williamsia sp.]
MLVIVEADGGSRGNPGVAGYGSVVFDADHDAVLAERKEYIGRATNNVAEYRGLIAGLKAARELGADEVSVRMDSKLVVEQMSGRWKVKHPDMIPLAQQARDLVAGFSRVDFAWIPRKQNSHADRLANEAMDAQAEGQVATTPEAAPPAEKPFDTAPSDTAPSAPALSKKDETGPGWTGAMGKPTRLLLVRHGQTALSVDRRYSGRGNPELTALGVQQADRVAHRIASRGGIAAIVSSPLSRARATAGAIARRVGLPVHEVEGFTETDFGEWEGLTFSEASQRYPELHRAWMSDTSVAPPGGESFDAVTERVRAATDQVVSEYGPGNVVVVSHVTPIKTVLRHALDVGPSILFKLHLDLASLSMAEFYADGGSSVRLVNDTNHLS